MSKHEYDEKEVAKNFTEDGLKSGISQAEIDRAITSGFLKSASDRVIEVNSLIQFTNDGKYIMGEEETTYTLSEDCKKISFKMSPSSENDFTIVKLNANKLVLDYEGITMEFDRVNK